MRQGKGGVGCSCIKLREKKEHLSAGLTGERVPYDSSREGGTRAASKKESGIQQERRGSV